MARSWAMLGIFGPNQVVRWRARLPDRKLMCDPLRSWAARPPPVQSTQETETRRIMSEHTFRRNGWPTLGVEVELQLVDAGSMALRSAIAELLAELPPELHDSV